jgi:hypothetical protein
MPWITYDHVLAALDLNGTRQEILANPSYPPIRNRAGHVVEPDNYMQCFDYLYRGEYYILAISRTPYDYDTVVHIGTWKCTEEWQPTWMHVGQHVHFTSRVEDITRRALRQAFGLASGEVIPPFVAIHVRRGDFEEACGSYTADECFAPLERYALRVEQVKRQLRQEHNVDAPLVLVTSDERNETWWDATRKFGWVHIDYAKHLEDEILNTWSVL